MLDHDENIRHIEVMKEHENWPSIRSQGHVSLVSVWNKYVDELLEENGKSIHCEEMVTGTERPVATKQKEQSTPPLFSLSTMVVPIDQRKWKDIRAVDFVNHELFDHLHRGSDKTYFSIA